MQPAARTPLPLLGPAGAVAMLAGVVLAAVMPSLPYVAASLAILFVGAVLAWRATRAGRLAGMAGIGFALCALHGAHALSMQLPHGWEKRDVVLRGRVAELPVHEPRRTRFVFDVDDDVSQPAPLRGRRLRLAWYDEAGGVRARIAAGQHWTLQARVRAPRGLRNPGGIDGEKHAVAQRIAATGYVRAPARARSSGRPEGLAAWRARMSARIAAAVRGAEARFVQALALGDTRGLGDADWATLRANGLTHLIAISGFHVGLVAGLFALGARAAWWMLPALGRACPRPTAAALAALGGAAAYAAAAGFALPTVRTLLMIAVVAAARTGRRSASAAQTLALATIAVLVVDPLAVLGAGFWLSFAGVAWLLWCLPRAGARPVRDFVSAQAVATIGLLPLGAALFGQASLAGPLANLLAIPWWSLVVVPLSLVGLGLETVAGGAGGWAWRAAASAFQPSWAVFERLGASPLALWWLPESRWFALPLALAGAFWLLLPRGVPGKPLALLLWLPLLWPDRRLPAPGEFDLHVLDVGQGLSVVVRTARSTLLYDMGPSVQDGFDAGERAVVPALRALGAGVVERAIVSHADNDHAGGLDAVRTELRLLALHAPDGAGVAGATACRAGMRWTHDGVQVEVLHPPAHFPYLRNEASCVLRVAGRNGVALLTGDIGEVVERELVRRHGARLRADVVVVAHHGSDGSSDAAFVAAVGARHALVSAGHGNRFGHPTPQVVARWSRAGARVHGTAQGGALRVRPGAGAVEARRHTHPRWWDAARRSAAAATEESAW